MTYRLQKSRTKRGSGMAEFAPSLMVFFFVMLFPLLNLMGLAMGAAVVAMISNQTVQAAANASGYTQALSSMKNCAVNLRNSGLGKFAKLTANGGYQGCGADLYVVETKLVGTTSKLYGPNSTVPPPIDTVNNVYEYQVRISFTVVPFINMSGIPLVNTIPGVGQPTTLNWTSHSNVEYPEGLVAAGLGGGGMGAGNGGIGGGGGGGSTSSAR